MDRKHRIYSSCRKSGETFAGSDNVKAVGALALCSIKAVVFSTSFTMCFKDRHETPLPAGITVPGIEIISVAIFKLRQAVCKRVETHLKIFKVASREKLKAE